MAQVKLKGILSYPHLFTPRAVNPGDDPKFSCTVLILKTDPQLLQVQAIIEQEKANGFPAGFPANGKVCLKDCAVDPTYNGDPRFHAYMAISCNNSDKPQVVDMNLQPLMDPSQIYAGCEAWVSIGIQCYNKPVNRGVGAYVNGVMPTGQEGALGRIDGRPTAQQMFGDVAGGVAPPTAPAPAPVAAPPVPPAPPAAPAPAPAPAPVPSVIMTAAANGVTLEAYRASGWSDDQLIAAGLAIKPSFA